MNLISDELPHGGLWYGDPNSVENAISYAQFFSRAHALEIRVFSAKGELIETHECGVRMPGDGISAPTT